MKVVQIINGNIKFQQPIPGGKFLIRQLNDILTPLVFSKLDGNKINISSNN